MVIHRTHLLYETMQRQTLLVMLYTILWCSSPVCSVEMEYIHTAWGLRCSFLLTGKFEDLSCGTGTTGSTFSYAPSPHEFLKRIALDGADRAELLTL